MNSRRLKCIQDSDPSKQHKLLHLRRSLCRIEYIVLEYRRSDNAIWMYKRHILCLLQSIDPHMKCTHLLLYTQGSGQSKKRTLLSLHKILWRTQCIFLVDHKSGSDQSKCKQHTIYP